MNNFTLSLRKYALVFGMLFLTGLSYSQSSYVEVSVNWPAYSSENRLEIYNPSGTLLTTIDNGFTGGINNSYATAIALGCLPDLNNYYFIMYDTANDGWDGVDWVTIDAGGTTVINQNGNAATPGGVTTFFNISGGGISTFPYNEGFETGLGAWNQSRLDTRNWTRQSGNTPTGTSGPTGANGGSFYMFTEGSNPNYNQPHDLISPCFDLSTATTAQFSFYYHMYGSNMGTLNVQLSTDGGLTFPTLLWSQAGQVQTSNGQAWNQVNLNLNAYVGQTINIRFNGTTGASWNSDMAIDDISLTTTTGSGPEINIQGNATTIVDGDTTPNVGDDTDFGSVNTTGGTQVHTFTIQNTGTTALSVGAITFSGTNAADFSITSAPAASVAASGNTTFDVTFNPSADGLRTAAISIVNDDTDENPYNYSIQGTGITPVPEINIQGNATTIVDGDTTPTAADDTDFGSVNITGGTQVHTFTIQNTGTAALSVGAITFSGAHAADFSITSAPAASVAASGSTTFDVTFNPSALGTRTAAISIVNGDSDENPYNYNIQGTGTTASFSDVVVSVNWPAYSSENRVEIYSPTGTLISTIDNGFTGGTNNNYSTTVSLGCLEDLNNYYFIMYDTANDGWDGADNITITVGGTNVINQNGDTATTAGITTFFNVSGGSAGAEIEITGNGNTILDGDTTPDITDSTDFGQVDVTSGTQTNTFTINNYGCTTALNLTGASPYAIISGTHASDFTVTAIPTNTIAAAGTTTFQVTFNPSAIGTRTASISIANDDSDENPYNFDITGEGITGPPVYTAYYETFDTDNGGWNPVTSTNDTWTWTSTYPVSVTDELAEGGFWRSGNFNNYANNTDIIIESPVYDFTGLQNLLLSLDIEYNTQNDTDGMRILYSISGGAYTLLGASGSGTNWYDDNTSALGTDGWNDDSHPTAPTFSGPYSHFKNASIALSGATFAGQSNVRFRIQFSSNGSSSDVGVGFDNFRIEADPVTDLNDASVAPADITSNLRLWLKMNAGVSATDGNALTSWEDQAYDTTLDRENANAAASLAPTYRDNINRNINYNPVADFDNSNTEYMNGKGGFFSQDYFVVVKSDDVVDTSTGTYTPGRQFAFGGRSDDTNYHEDPTGVAFGSSTARYVNEVIAHNIGAYANGATASPGVDSYGRAYTSATETFNHVMIINVKSNAGRTATELYKNGKQIDNTTATTGTSGTGTPLDFYEFDNLSFIVGAGRSGLNGRTTSQLNGMLGEVVSYNAPNSALNQQKIQTYLGIKYGVTLQAPASALTDYRLNDVDYIDSNGDVIWDTSANTAHNYDVAGIGRDDASQLNQKQSISQNIEADGTGPTSGFLTMALTQTYNTNNQNISSNATTFNDREFLVWGNNNASLNAAASNVTVDMSADIGGGLVTEVEFTAIQRIWKVVETGGDIPSVEVSIPTTAVRAATPPDGRYLMFISATGIFDPTADYRVMTENAGVLTADYDFDGTEYITFGWAPEREFVRSIYFDPADGNYVDVEDHLDLEPTGFTVSVWVKREDRNITILSKRDASFTTGYELDIPTNRGFRMRWYNGGSLQELQSTVQIPDSEWHHLAVIYDGSTATMYIDGVADDIETLSPPTATSESFFIGAGGKNSPNKFFHGNIDEVRVWDTALSQEQLRYIMNQEIEDNASFVRGKYFESRSITPTKADTDTLPWGDLAGYYPMSIYTYTNTKDESGNGHQGALKNLRTVDYQTAPLPYISTQNGDWDDMNTWQNGSVQTIPGTSSIVDNTLSVDWNIVRTSHNITIDDDSDLPTENEANRNVLALFVDSNELVVDGDNSAGTGYGLTVTHYLNLDGNIDLDGQSQLVQSTDSDLEVASSGLLEKDQQGTRDFYTYDYWAAPVGISNTTSNNNSYTLPDVLRNGTNPATPNAITFLTSGYDGNVSGSNISIADYWIWKFANQLDDDYSAWQHVRSTGTLNIGEGYTMKGVEDTAGNVIFEQNYTFIGKPNNAGISLTLNAGNDYLVGNPYPSAMDAIQFIQDNGPELDFTDPGGTPETDPLISGTLYFWDHWGGGSHNLAEYQGGYATYNYSGGVAAAAMGTNDPDVGTGGTPIYLPTRYIPVGKGFFVIGETTGTIDFNNGQRVYHNPDAPTSRSSYNSNPNYSADSEDLRMKLRIGFSSVNTIRRQLLVTQDENATAAIDYGFDGVLYEQQIDDVYWMIEDEKYLIQGTDVIDEQTVFPLGIHTQDDGTNSFTIDSLTNAPEDIEVYVHDIDLGIYHNLQEDGDYEFYSIAGEHLNRFEIVFDTGSLSVDENEINGVNIYYSNDIDSIVLVNPTHKEIRSIELFNILGQNVYSEKVNTNSDYAEYKVSNLSTGTYIIKLNTLSGTISKKVLVE